MEPGLHSPLVDFFRRGEVARDVRLLAARGALAPRAHEQLALLLLLVDDADPEIRQAAALTIRGLPPELLSAFLARSDVPAEMRAFFSGMGIEPAAAPAPSADDPLVEAGGDPLSDTEGDAGELEPATEEERKSLVSRLALMSVSEKVTRGMKGSREERAILIRDHNKLVAVAVLSSPKLTESEVETFARMANVTEEVLRIIGHNRAWMKNYTIASALARNPKTPLAMSLNILNRLIERDLKAISIDRNVPEPLRLAARKRIVIGEKK